jgi:two-component system, chemotaxis family, CheB/CheR fusion protein
MRKKSEAGISVAKPVRPVKPGVHKTPDTEQAAAGSRFPVVALGASAGGLEALTQFLGHVPDNSGLAFVVIQHLDPTHVGILPELLQRATRMEVRQVKDRTRVKPDCVYVIPPDKEMSILHGQLHLFQPVEPRGLRLPIDFFFRSLAEDYRESAIGVILSGMGSDGTLGLRAIKEKGGLCLAQEPDSAKFSGMPNSAIGFGLADIVAPADKLPEKIIDYLSHVPTFAKPKAGLEDKDLSSLEKIVILLRAKTGNDFSAYKKSTMYRRIERRMGIHQIDSIAAYVRYLQANAQELELLFKELLIGVTNFFRDPAAWAKLQSEVIPALLAERPDGVLLRAWSAGCSTGEEAYSLAIVFKEALEKLRPLGHFTMQIFATDLDQGAIDKARRGFFPLNIAADVSTERLDRFFVKEEKGYLVGKDIREMVTFATQNVVSEPPFTRLDILICRNLLIYLDVEIQKKILPLFQYALNPGGVLFLGSAETLSTSADLFTPLDGKLRLFKCNKTVGIQRMMPLPTSFLPSMPEAHKEPFKVKPEVNLQLSADRILLQRFSPPAVLVNGNGDIVYTSARTGKYLEPPVGKTNWNIFAMAREGLQHELYGAFRKALKQSGPVVARNLRIGTNGGTQVVDLHVEKLEEADLLGMVMIVFKDIVAGPVAGAGKRPVRSADAAAQIDSLELELQRAREELQTAREEMQTTQEELKASNEELQSMNEELQSSNEELTTSKEEMQSMNEELQTVNAEQQARVDELTRLNDDMNNFLNSTEVATIFLDHRLNLRRFAIGTNKIFKLIASDVGRPLSDIANDLCYPELSEDVAYVLKTLIFTEKQIKTTDGRCFAVRIMPYRTYGNVIDGVVMTLTDISGFKKLEEDLREKINSLEQAAKR